MLDLLFSCGQQVLQSEKGSGTLPDNPTLPAPQDLIPPLFAKTLISKNNTDFKSVCVAKLREKLYFKANGKKKKSAKETKEGKTGEKGEERGDRVEGSLRLM